MNDREHPIKKQDHVHTVEPDEPRFLFEDHLDETIRELRDKVGVPKVVFMMGNQQGLASEQACRVAKDTKFTHISMGKLVRNYIQSNLKGSKYMANLRAKGELLPNYIAIQLLVKHMIVNPSEAYTICGFPRTEA